MSSLAGCPQRYARGLGPLHSDILRHSGEYVPGLFFALQHLQRARAPAWSIVAGARAHSKAVIRSSSVNSANALTPLPIL